MVQENGYFTIELIGDEAICRVYPPKEGAERVTYRDLSSYLDAHGFSYDVKEINRSIFSNDTEEFTAIPTSKVEYSDSMYVGLTDDRMKAVARFYPGSLNGGKMSAKDIMAGLQQKGVKFGIDQEAIMQFLANPVYCTDITLAKGNPPVEGHDARIEYFFNTNPNTRPAYNEDGSVDFHTLDVISQVYKGQLIAKLFPEDRGKNGRNVLGTDTLPRPVKPSFLQVGRNITLSEDRTEAYSDVTGHATLVNGQVFVSDIYEVPADVDNSTGDINYDGNVYVKGSVREGFKITAKGDVIIDGTVEGAEIYSGSQIVIKRGVNGMNRGLLKANGNIISKFIENAKVYCGGYVDTGSIIHSGVVAKGDVIVNDKKGFISGSVVKSGGRVEAQTIGSSMGSATKIEIGIDPDTKEKYSQLDADIRRMNAENAKVMPIIKNYKELISQGQTLDPKNKEYYIKLKQLLVNNKEKLEPSIKEFEMLKQELEKGQDAKIIVSRDIYPGVTVICSDVSLTIKDKRSHVYLERKDGEIVIQNL